MCVFVCVTRHLPSHVCLCFTSSSILWIDSVLLFQFFDPLSHQPLGKYMPPMLMRCKPINTRHELSLSGYGKSWPRKLHSVLTLFASFLSQNPICQQNDWMTHHPYSQVLHSCSKSVGGGVRLGDKWPWMAGKGVGHKLIVNKKQFLVLEKENNWN